MDDCHGVVPWVSSPGFINICPFIDRHLLYSTITFQAVFLFGGYVRHVMSVTLPKLFKLM